MKKLFLSTLLIAAAVVVMAQRPTVSILGDSYSTFENHVTPDSNAVWYFYDQRTTTDVTDVRQQWWYHFIKRNNCRLCVNNSYSGSTVCHTGYRSKEGVPGDYYTFSFLTRARNLGCPDIIFIFGATNDSWANVPIGEYQYSKWTKEDCYNFRPAMAAMLSEIGDRYPNVEVYFLLNDSLKPEINESVETICAHYGVHCIVLQEIDKITGHPSQKGMEQICEQIEAYMKAHKTLPRKGKK